MQCGKHMFGRRNGRAVVIAEYGGEFGRGHATEVGGDLAIALAAETAAHKNDAGIGFGGMQRESDGRTGVNTDSRDSCVTTQRGLTAGDHAPRHADVPQHLVTLREQERTLAAMTHPNLRECSSICIYGEVRTRLTRLTSPKIPSDGLNVLARRSLANTRFLTECYHVPAALRPAWCREIADIEHCLKRHSIRSHRARASKTCPDHPNTDRNSIVCGANPAARGDPR